MKNLVVKHNALVNASYSLSLVEQRLVLLGIIHARKSQTPITSNTTLEIHASQYIEQFKVERHTAYETLKEAAIDLFKKEFCYTRLYKGSTEVVHARWVSEVSYVEDHALIRFSFANPVIPLITELESRFTQYDLEQVADLSSSYAIRLYELLIAWRSTGKTPLIPLDEFREKLGVFNDEYTRIEAFKRRVLDLAISQINQHTDISATYEQHKAGRTIIGFSFTFKQKKPKTAKRKTYTHADLEKKPNLAKPGETYEQALERLNSNSKL